MDGDNLEFKETTTLCWKRKGLQMYWSSFVCRQLWAEKSAYWKLLQPKSSKIALVQFVTFELCPTSSSPTEIRILPLRGRRYYRYVWSSRQWDSAQPSSSKFEAQFLNTETCESCSEHFWWWINIDYYLVLVCIKWQQSRKEMLTASSWKRMLQHTYSC